MAAPATPLAVPRRRGTIAAVASRLRRKSERQPSWGQSRMDKLVMQGAVQATQPAAKHWSRLNSKFVYTFLASRCRFATRWMTAEQGARVAQRSVARKLGAQELRLLVRQRKAAGRARQARGVGTHEPICHLQ